jgi:hypothetical protein
MIGARKETCLLAVSNAFQCRNASVHAWLLRVSTVRQRPAEAYDGYGSKNDLIELDAQ